MKNDKNLKNWNDHMCCLKLLQLSLISVFSGRQVFSLKLHSSQPQMCKLQQCIESSSSACRQQQNPAIVQFSSSLSCLIFVECRHGTQSRVGLKCSRKKREIQLVEGIKFALRIALRHTRRSRFCVLVWLKYSCFDKLIFFWFCLLFVVAEFASCILKRENFVDVDERWRRRKLCKSEKFPAKQQRRSCTRADEFTCHESKSKSSLLVEVSWAEPTRMWVDFAFALIILIFTIISRCYKHRTTREFCRWENKKFRSINAAWKESTWKIC